jgi:hypothetical protein
VTQSNTFLGTRVLVIWIIFWKGWALWIAARKGEFWWFLVILIVNTFGILEIVYLFVFKKLIFNFKTKKFEERKEKVSEIKKETLDLITRHLASQYSILHNDNLTLITIKNYSQEAINFVKGANISILDQRSRNTCQLLIRSDT